MPDASMDQIENQAQSSSLSKSHCLAPLAWDSGFSVQCSFYPAPPPHSPHALPSSHCLSNQRAEKQRKGHRQYG